MRNVIYQGALYLFLSLPSLVLLYSLVFTMMSQIQQGGAKLSIQVQYWLPITWQEHTLASTLSHLLGFPLASIIAISLAILTSSIFLNLVAFALFTTLALFASAFLASITTDIFRVLQTRSIGAIYKSSGRAAIWVRFIGSIVFLVVFYVIWFTFTQGSNVVMLIQMVAGAQGAIWYIPYIWPGIALASLIGGNLLNALVYSIASAVFVFLLFLLAVRLNARFGLYEPPAITVSKGAYFPKKSFLERVGFSSLDAALIRKDLRAFTRRRELIYIFIAPLVIVLMPLLTVGYSQGAFPSFLSIWTLLLPGALMSMYLGAIIIGEEGSSIWLLLSSPINARELVKSKYAFVVLISCLSAMLCDIVGILIGRPSLNLVIVALIESLLLILALAAVSVGSGVKGAQFVETPRPRMVSPMTSFTNFLKCLVVGVIIILPLLPNGLHLFASSMTGRLPELSLPIAVMASTVVSLVITYLFYRVALRNAKQLLAGVQV